MANPVKSFIECVHGYFLEGAGGSEVKNVDYLRNATSFFRQHTEKLKERGDFSFSASYSTWQNCFGQTGNIFRDEAFQMFNDTESGDSVGEKEAACNKLLNTSQHWVFPIERIQVKNERCTLFLQRITVMNYLLRRVLKNDCDVAAPQRRYGECRKNTLRRIRLRRGVPSSTESLNLSLYRAKLVEDTLRRILEYSEWSLDDAERSEEDIGCKLADDGLIVQVLTVAAKGYQKEEANSNVTTIKCGIVIDPLTNKLATIDASEYHGLRTSDMRLMAMHKYGIRVKDDVRFCALMERLGAAAVTVDLMEVKHSSPVRIIRNGQGSTKGSSFILYNSARLESLLRTFDERVQNSAYKEFPDLDDIDVCLLNEEEEWQLTFCYVAAFPNLLEQCIGQLERGNCATHLIVRYLSDFVRVFSVYYRRIRILTEGRAHLMPSLYARIYLLKAVQKVLNQALALLNIEPVQYM